MSPSLVVVLLNWNSYEHTANCIRSLQACTGTPFDIIVVDNGSTDDSGLQIHTEFPSIIYLPAPSNEGFAGGNNRGFHYAIANGYTYAMMLNNDVFVEPNFITELVNYMDMHLNVGAIQPKIFFNNNRKKLWNGGSYFLGLFGWTYSKRYMRTEGPLQNEFQEVDWITGCALLTRTSILKELGLLNEQYFIYFEDVDFSFRIRAAGHTLIFHPKSVIYHIAGMANKAKKKGIEGYANPIVHYLNFRNNIWFLRTWTKWYHLPTTILTQFAYTLSIMLYFALRWRWIKLASMLKGIYHGVTKNSIG